MLYDPKWEKKTATDPLSLEGLIAWLETKNPDESYNFHDCKGACLWDQYMGRCTGSEEYEKIWKHFRTFGFSAATSPRTFGAALARARAALAESQP